MATPPAAKQEPKIHSRGGEWHAPRPVLRASDRSRYLETLLLAVVVIAATVAKLTLLEAGPEPDPDAYAHAIAGRKLVAGEGGVEIHWVWLPLWHWVHGLASRYADGTWTVRGLNIALTSAAPIVLASILRRGAGRRGWERWLPISAGCVLALTPLSLRHGATSQLEPPLLALMLGAAWLLDDGEGEPRAARAFAAGALLAAATMVRYEAWCLPPLVAGWWWWRGRAPRGASAWLLPGLAIAAWCLYHRLETGEWLQFLRYNRGFTRDYYAGAGFPNATAPGPWISAVWYLAVVPFYQYGWLVVPLAIGAPWLVRRAPRPLLVMQLGVLAFLSVGFATRQHLGLARHALSIAPAYATCIAAGALGAAAFVERRLATASPEAGRLRGGTALGVLAVVLSVLVYWRGAPDFRDSLRWHREGYRSAWLVAQALRRAYRPDDWVLCDWSGVEVLANLPPERTSRWTLRDTSEADLATACGRCERVLIASTEADVAHLRPLARELFAAGDYRLLAYVAEPARP
jgi:hypothetical protein